MLPLIVALLVAAAPPDRPEGAQEASRPAAEPAPAEGASDAKSAEAEKGTRGADRAAPAWTPAELRTYFTEIPRSETARSVEEKDSFLADVVGAAYRVPRQPREATEVYSKRVARRRDPNHPNVKKGQWLLAAMRLFYQDAGARADALSRFERDKGARLFLEAKAREAKQVAAAIGGMIEIVVEGMEGFLQPLPIAEGGEPKPHGCEATVKNGVITIDNLERSRWVEDAPPANAVRTAKGAIKELYAAQKQYNVSASMLGMYEATWRKNKGNLRVVIPAAAPAAYLNELVLGGLEAEMQGVQIMCMSPKGELRSLEVSLSAKAAKASAPRKGAKGKAAAKGPVEVRCASTLAMQKCAERIAEARRDGPVVYVVE